MREGPHKGHPDDRDTEDYLGDIDHSLSGIRRAIEELQEYGIPVSGNASEEIGEIAMQLHENERSINSLKEEVENLRQTNERIADALETIAEED